MSDILDTVIIGAGPAGLAAGVYAARAEMNLTKLFVAFERKRENNGIK